MRHVFVVINGTSPHPRVVIVVVGCRWGLRLTAARCRHWGYMGVATRVGGAPRPCVVIGSAWGCGLHYPHRRFGRGALRRALVEGLLYHPIVVVIGDAQRLRLALVEQAPPRAPMSASRHREYTGVTACVTAAAASSSLWLGLHAACNSHWQSASWRCHRHGCHRARLHRRHGLGRTLLTA